MKLDAIIALIDMRSLTLPRFQRGYVWKRPDVSKLMRSLYKGYPVGSLLIWETHASQQDVRGDQQLAAGAHKLLLDGQQRVTSLYGIINDKLPAFSDGDVHSFRNLYFNVETEEFEFYGPVKMKDDPRWISVTDLMQRGIGPYFPRFANHSDSEIYVNRLLTIASIKGRDFHVETVSGADKDMDTVVDIFNQVNSGGTKLSKGDLALAKICAYWPHARQEMQARINKWAKHGHKFSLDWVLRCINAILTGQSDFAELDKQDFIAADILDGLKRVEQHVDRALTIIEWRLGLDHHQVMGSPNALPAIVRFLDRQNSFPSDRIRDRLLYWYIHAMLWGRYSGPIETVIRQDIMAVDEHQDATMALIERLRQNRGSLRVEPQDFAGWTRGNRFYPLLYMLTRVYGTRDLGFGNEIKKGLPGGDFELELHHIFPKAQLRKYGFQVNKEVNAVANFTFLFRKTNREIWAKKPEDYFPFYESKHPGVLASHWIPEDPKLWKIENYRDFLAARRELLAKAANDFLGQLLHGEMAEAPVTESTYDHRELPRPASIASDEEEVKLNEAMAWMEENGLPSGEYGFELVAADGEYLATLDLVWSQGIQTGLGEKVALLINEDAEILEIARQHDFKYFTTFEQLQQYVQQEILGEPTPM